MVSFRIPFYRGCRHSMQASVFQREIHQMGVEPQYALYMNRSPPTMLVQPCTARPDFVIVTTALGLEKVKCHTGRDAQVES